MDYNPLASSGFLWTARDVLLRPMRFFGGMSADPPVTPAVVFAIFCQLLYFIFGSGYDVVSATLTGSLAEAQAWSLSGVPAIAAAFGYILILTPLLAVIGVYVFALVLHALVFASATPEREDFSASVKVAAYSGAVFLFVWIPAIGVVASIYGGILAAVGVRTLHEVSPIKSAAIGIVLTAPLLVYSGFSGGVGLV